MPKAVVWGSAGSGLLRIVGILLTILGLSFTAYIVLESDAIGRMSWGIRSCLVLLGGCGAYAIFSVLLVVVWRAILDAFAPGCIGVKDSFVLYAISQIMKYIPSNVLHFVGRHVVLRRRGASHSALIFTVLAESAILIVGAVVTVVLLERSMLTDVYQRYVPTSGVVVGLMLAAALALLVTALWMRGRPYRALFAPGLGWRVALRVPVALVSAGAFFISTTLLVATICRLLLDDPAGYRATGVAAALAAAWVVGFVMPGTSAGIGVRESAAILLLMPAVGPGNAAAIATLYRLITAGGDALLAGLGILVRRLSAGQTLGGN
jgi:glycosyltransferase 2 family protein